MPRARQERAIDIGAQPRVERYLLHTPLRLVKFETAYLPSHKFALRPFAALLLTCALVLAGCNPEEQIAIDNPSSAVLTSPSGQPYTPAQRDSIFRRRGVSTHRTGL